MSNNVHALELSLVNDMLCLCFVTVQHEALQLINLCCNLWQIMLHTVNCNMDFPFQLLCDLVAKALKFVRVESCLEFLGGARKQRLRAINNFVNSLLCLLLISAFHEFSERRNLLNLQLGIVLLLPHG